MKNSEYSNMVFPSSATFPTTDSDCCSSATGAAPAASAQEYPSDALAKAATGASVVSAQKSSRGRGGCRCWLVALAAVVLIAVAAKS